MKSTVCYFIPTHSDQHAIHVVNMVFETEHRITKIPQSKGLFRIHYVYSGSGMLCLADKQVLLKGGDIFFTFPDTSFYMNPVSQDFSYLYISYTGSRANIIMEKTGIGRDHYLIHDCGNVKFLWEEAADSPANVSGWMAESVLLYTFSHLFARLQPTEKSLCSF